MHAATRDIQHLTAPHVACDTTRAAIHWPSHLKWLKKASEGFLVLGLWSLGSFSGLGLGFGGHCLGFFRFLIRSLVGCFDSLLSSSLL
jgi:hypothetical protein